MIRLVDTFTKLEWKNTELFKRHNRAYSLYSICLIVALLFANVDCDAQGQEGSVNYIVSDNSVSYYAILKSEKGLSKEELYRIAENYFTYNYRSGKDVIQSKDPERFSITGSGVYGDVNHIHSWGTGIDEDYSAPHVITIECRDGRVRVSVTISVLDVIRHGNRYIKSGSYTVNIRHMSHLVMMIMMT